MLKEFYSEHPYSYHLESSINILLYLIYQMAINLIISIFVMPFLMHCKVSGIMYSLSFSIPSFLSPSPLFLPSPLLPPLSPSLFLSLPPSILSWHML